MAFQFCCKCVERIWKDVPGHASTNDSLLQDLRRFIKDQNTILIYIYILAKVLLYFNFF